MTAALPSLVPASLLEEFQAAAADNGGIPLAGLADLRRAAFDRFVELGFPTTRDEDWHYTSVAPIAETDWRTLRTPSPLTRADDLAPFLFGRPEWPRLVFVDGRFEPALSSLGRLPAGIRAMDLATAARELPDLLGQHLARHADAATQPFTALNTAFFGDGAVVYVPRDVASDTPVHLLFVADANAAKGVAHPRTLIVADRHSKATVIESYVALGDAHYFTNAVTEVMVGEGATLQHYKIQRESARAYHVGTIDTRQARDSHYVSFSYAAGAELFRTNIYTMLDGEGCGATLNGLFMLDGEQHGDHQTRIEHAQPNCFSREVYKGILDDASHAVWNGKVFVQAIAQKTDGKQENHTLLLSDRARIDTKPQLEIFADDVKCTHGATVGRIDEMALFYMKSRGLDREIARRLLTYAFAADVLEKLEQPDVKEALEALTLERFVKAE